MKQTVKLRLLPTPDQASALKATLSACNNAATWLSAQPAILVIRKAVAAYTTLRANLSAGSYGPPGSDRRRKVAAKPIAFRQEAGQPFDARCLSWQIPESGREATVSIWTVAGRMRNLRFLGKPEHLRLLRSRTIGETDLIHHDGLGARLNRYRARQRRIRTRLQAKNTSSARRLLKNRRRKEARFATDLNHQISKNIVAVAERTGRGIAVERLTGIRARVRLRKPQRATLHSWAFGQLGEFLQYKATLSGVTLIQVDPAFTSQTCHPCGHVDKRSRRSQAKFICVRCGFVGHADHNAACNIAERAVAGWGEIMRPDAAPTLASS